MTLSIIIDGTKSETQTEIRAVCEMNLSHSRVAQDQVAQDQAEERRKCGVVVLSQQLDHCRITCARLVESRSMNGRTYQARRQQTKKSRLKTSFLYFTLFSLFVYK